MTETKARASDAKRRAPPRRKPAAGPEGPAKVSCTVSFCPVCTALGAVQEVRPDVVGHLLTAGRELLLALRGVIDARTEDAERPAQLEKIHIA